MTRPVEWTHWNMPQTSPIFAQDPFMQPEKYHCWFIKWWKSSVFVWFSECNFSLKRSTLSGRTPIKISCSPWPHLISILHCYSFWLNTIKHASNVTHFCTNVMNAIEKYSISCFIEYIRKSRFLHDFRIPIPPISYRYPPPCRVFSSFEGGYL